jgi:DNA-binding response OmpR family regulator
MRVILIEDEKEFADNCKLLLEKRGFAVDVLYDAEKAHNRILLYRREYDVIILDLSMPGTNGRALTQKLRAAGISTPIIILTGNGELKSKVALLNSGADDYVVKPFSIDELLARIAAVMRRPYAAKPIITTVGPMTIDTAKHLMTIKGVEVKLTLKEYALLEFFMRRPGEVISREELSNTVWDFASVTLSNVLDVHMKNLRKKVQAAEGSTRTRFETVRGIGYKFNV